MVSWRASPGLRGRPIQQPAPRPQFVLTDTDGERYDFASRTAGQLSLLFFGYAGCRDICPHQIGTLAAAIQRADDRVTVVMVSVDPLDDQARLRLFLDRFDRSFVGLTGDPRALHAAQVSAGVTPAIGADQSRRRPGSVIGHHTDIIAYGPDDLARATYPIGTSAEDWEHDLPLLARPGDPGSPTAAG